MIQLSIVIATYNRAVFLERTLRSLDGQTAPARTWECVVVDNNSQDDTSARFSAFAADHPELQLRMVRETRQGLSPARNRGIAESRGVCVAIVDDDELLNAEFVASYLDFFDTRPDALVAGGRVIPEYMEGRPRWMSGFTEQPIANPTDWGDSVREFPAGHIPAGGNMAFRRDVFERVGGFDPSLGRTGTTLLGGEESDLFERLAHRGVRFWYVPGAIIRHVIPPAKLTPDYFRRLCFNVGVSQRRRAVLHGRLARLFAAEAVKWCVTLAVALSYVATFRFSRAVWLVRMRWHITKGLARG